MFIRPYGPTASEIHSSLFSLQVPSGSQRLPARTRFERPVRPKAFMISMICVCVDSTLLLLREPHSEHARCIWRSHTPQQ